VDVNRFKQVFDTLDEEGQKNVISQLSDDELNAISNFKQPKNVSRTYAESMSDWSSSPEVRKQVREDVVRRMTDFSPIEQTVRNLPGSFIQDFVKPVAEVVTSPVQTLRGLGTLAGEILQGRPGPAMQSVAKSYIDDYGGEENIRNTLINRPVKALGDISLASGVAGGVLKAAGATNAGQAASAISNATNPATLAAEAYKVAAPVVKATAANVLGRTTGSGAQAMYKAIEGKPEFVKAMRGNVDDLEVVEKAQQAFGSMKEARAANYRKQLEGIKAATKEIDISDIKALADDWLDKFGVQKTDKGLDFSRSTISGSAVNDVTSIYDDIQNWGAKAGDKTPIMLDTLKRRISDFYTQNGKAMAMSASLSNAVQKKISSVVPEYGKMTSDYEKASSFIKQTEQAVLSKDPKAVDTALRKIMMGVREDKGLRRSLMDDMSKFSDEDILSLAAGRVSNPWFTRRLESSVVGTAGVVLGASIAPLMFALIPMSSPRLAAEASVLLGRTARAIEKGARKIPRSAYLAAQQVGQTQLSDDGNKIQQPNR